MYKRRRRLHDVYSDIYDNGPRLNPISADQLRVPRGRECHVVKRRGVAADVANHTVVETLNLIQDLYSTW